MIPHHYITLFCFLLVSTAVKSQVVADFNIAPTSNGVYCNPQNVSFTDASSGSGILYYDWNFGILPGTESNATNPQYSYSTAGTYTVTLVMHNSLNEWDTAYQTITIENSPQAVFGMNDTTVCPGTAIDFKDLSTGLPISFTWNFADAVSANNISNLQDPSHQFNIAGNYPVTLIATTSEGCSDTAVNTIYTIAPSVNAGNDFTLCPNTLGHLLATGATSYTWSPSTFLSNINIADPFTSPSQTITYTVTGTDANGCIASDDILVMVLTAGFVNAGNDKTICTGNNVGLQATGLNTYTWTPATGLNNPNIPNPIATLTTTQVYTVSGTDQNGCSVSDDVIVHVNPIPVADAGIDVTICHGESTYVQGNGGNNFQWFPNNGLVNANSYMAFCSPTVTTTYTLVVSNGGTCVDSDQVVIHVTPTPTIVSSGTKIICPGDAVQLSVSGATSFTWSPSIGLSQTNIANPIASLGSDIDYVVTAAGMNGCNDTAHITVSVKIPDDVAALPGGTVCLGEQLQLSAWGAQSYEWFPNEGLDNPYVPEPYASPTHDITYKVIGFDGCYYDSTYVEVTLNHMPPVSVGDNVYAIPNAPIQLSASGEGTFEWYPATGLDCSDCAEPLATVNETTTYIVTNNNPNGCRTSDTLVIHAGCADAVFFVPNAFTPNNDGKNDRFYLRTKGIKQLDFFRVFNRSGQLLFETHDATEGWDGSYKGCKLPPGVFSYSAQVTCHQGDPIQFVGNVTLIR